MGKIDRKVLASPAAALIVGVAAPRACVNMGFDGPVVMGTEAMMADKGKGHGTSAVAIQKDLRWNCDVETANRICNFNRHYAEYGGFWERATSFLREESEASGEITFYDSNTGRPLFYGPRDRTWGAFVQESKAARASPRMHHTVAQWRVHQRRRDPSRAQSARPLGQPVLHQPRQRGWQTAVVEHGSCLCGAAG